MATLVEMLRQKNEAKAEELKAKQASENWAQFNATPQEAVVSSGPSQTTRIGDSHILIPEQKSINYGGILSNAIGNFMGVRSKRQAADAAAKNEALSQQFMGEMLQDNPEAMKVYQLHQLGMPGMEKKLADLVAPEKEKLVNFIQHVKNIPDNLTDEEYTEIGKPWGISATMVKNYAMGAAQSAKDEFERKQKGEMELIDYRARRDEATAAKNRASAERVAQIRADAKGKTGTGKYGNVGTLPDGRPDYTTTYTPGEMGRRAGMIEKTDKELSQVQKQVSKFNEVYTGIKSMTPADWNKQGVYKLIGNTVPIIGAPIAERLKADPIRVLHNYTKDKVLDDMASFGGNDSIEELKYSRSDVPDEYTNQADVIKSVERFDKWYRTTARAIELKRDSLETGEYYRGGASRNFYREAEAELAQEAAAQNQGQQAPAAPPPPPPPGVAAPPPPSAPGGFQLPPGYGIREK